jgi:hypothetical protein
MKNFFSTINPGKSPPGASFKIVFIQRKLSTLDGWYYPNLLGANGYRIQNLSPLARLLFTFLPVGQK